MSPAPAPAAPERRSDQKSSLKSRGAVLRPAFISSLFISHLCLLSPSSLLFLTSLFISAFLKSKRLRRGRGQSRNVTLELPLPLVPARRCCPSCSCPSCPSRTQKSLWEDPKSQYEDPRYLHGRLSPWNEDLFPLLVLSSILSIRPPNISMGELSPRNEDFFHLPVLCPTLSILNISLRSP